MKQTIVILLYILFILSPSSAFAADERQDDRLAAAIRQFQEADYNNSIENLKKISSESDGSKTSLEAAYLIGMAYRAAGNLNDAAEWLQKASIYEPLADYALYYIGDVYMTSGNYQGAYEIFYSLRSRFPESRWIEDAGFKSSLALFQLGRYMESRSSMERFIKECPKSPLIPQARISAAECGERTGELRKAYNLYKAVWINHPASPESKTALERMNKLSSSGEALTSSEAPACSVSIDEQYSRSCNLFSANGNRDGINELAAILKRLEKDGSAKPQWLAEALLKLGDAYYQVKDDVKAIAAFNRLSRMPYTPKIQEEALFIKGKAHQRLGQKAEAFAVFESLVRDYPAGTFAAKAMLRLAEMTEGDGDTARTKSLYHGLYAKFPQSDLADDALWKEAWIAYMEKDYKEAYSILKRLLTEYPLSEFADTATYWSGRTAERMGKDEDAVFHYAEVISKFPISYYAAIARGRLSVISPDLPNSNITTASYIPQEESIVPDRYVLLHMSKGKALIGLGFNRDASAELSLAEARCYEKGALLDIARLMSRIGEFNKAQRAAMKGFQDMLKKNAVQPDSEIWTYVFPAGFREDVRANAEKNSVNPFLIHAIIKEESAYKTDIVSRAGAIGLMQLMPATGSYLSKEIGFKEYSASSLYRSEVNIFLGSRYLKKLIEGSRGKIPLAIASYNAGPNAVSSWVEMYGTEEMDEFIERVPYNETRNYIKKVLRSYDLYERIYGMSNQKEASFIGPEGGLQRYR